MTRALRRSVTAVAVLALAATAAVMPVRSAAAVDFVDVIVVLDTRPPDPGTSVRVTAGAVRSKAHAQIDRVGGQVTNVFSSVFEGYSARIPEPALAVLEANPAVAWVERDQVVSVAAQDIPTGVDRIFAPANDDLDIDSTDDWRVDVDVAVLDTGIDATHPDLNVVSSINCLNVSSVDNCSTSGTADQDGHGTHVAGTIGALDNDFGVVGVAPGARLWNVRVLDETGTGTLSGVIAGMDWVTARADEIEVLNMSLSCGGCTSGAFETSVTNAVEAGVVVVVAAGNANTDAVNTIPSSYTDAISVSAIADYDGLPGGLASRTCSNYGVDDARASFSNYGPVVDVAAPGACILSTWPVGDGSYNTISGTSMASPAVAGAAALLASGANDPTDRAGVEAIRATLLSTGNSDWTDNSGDGVKEPLLDVSSASFAPALIEGSEGPSVHGLLRVVTSPAVESQILVDGQARNSWGLNWVKMAPGSYELYAAVSDGDGDPGPDDDGDGDVRAARFPPWGHVTGGACDVDGGRCSLGRLGFLDRRGAWFL
jgi:subtilisin family serine protease